MHAISRSLAAVVLSLTPMLGFAQQAPRPATSPEPIPRELALALVNITPGMMGAGDILIGKAPEDIPAELIAPGVQVLGSMTQFDNVVIVVAAPQSPDSAISLYEARLIAAGWTKPPTPQVQPMRGFVPADAVSSGPYGGQDLVCRGDAFVMFTGSYRMSTGAGSLLKVSYNRGSRYSMCKNRQDVTPYRSPYDEAPIPILRAPFGAMPTDGNSMTSSGMNAFAMTTRLSTRLKAVEVVAHYDKQMRDQGWASLGDGNVQALAVHTYRKNDDKGRTWNGMLFSISFPDSLQQDVTLRLSKSQQAVAK